MPCKDSLGQVNIRWARLGQVRPIYARLGEFRSDYVILRHVTAS